MKFLIATIWLLSLIILSSMALAIDESKYEMEIDYFAIKIPGLDNEGYMFVQDVNSSFYWKAELFAPEDAFVIGFGPFTPKSELRVHLKDIKGQILIPKNSNFPNREKYKVVERQGLFSRNKEITEYYYAVDDVNGLVLIEKIPSGSFLGYYFVDVPRVRSVPVNGRELNSATIYIPKSRKIFDYSGPATTFHMNKHSYFSHRYQTMSVVYVDEMQLLLVQLALGAIALVIILVILKFYELMPAFGFSSKHLGVAILICMVLMVQLGFLVPNPKPIVVDLDEKLEYGNVQLPYYMRYVMGFTESIDAIVIRTFNWCDGKIFNKERGIYLFAKGAKKFFLLADPAKDPKGCIKMFEENAAGKKIEQIGENELNSKISELSNKFASGLLFDLSRRVIFILFIVIGFVASAYLVLKSYEIKGRKGLWQFAIVAFFLGLFILFGNVITGYLANMPVTYHGASEMPFTMSAKALPFVTQAHNLRLAVIMLGILVPFIVARKIREQTNIRVFLIPVLVFVLLLTLPQTEFSTKRFISSLACGECGSEYRGKLETFNVQKIFASIRKSEDVGMFIEGDDEADYAVIERALAQKLNKEAAEALENFIGQYPESMYAKDAMLRLAELRRGFREYGKAAEIYERLLKVPLDESTRFGVVTDLRYSYENLGEYAKIEGLVEEQLDNFQNQQFRGQLQLWKAENYLKMRDKRRAMIAYQEVIDNYAGQVSAKEAREKLERLKTE